MHPTSNTMDGPLTLFKHAAVLKERQKKGSRGRCADMLDALRAEEGNARRRGGTRALTVHKW